MVKEPKNWNSKALYLLGMWLWKQKEYGHALLCFHGSQWGLKIGTLLSITWEDVINMEDGTCKHELWLPKNEVTLRSLGYYSIRKNIETAYSMLPIKNIEDSIYMNYKTGKPLTSSTLNRELQRFSQKFTEEMKEKTGLTLNFKPLKTNAFEIAWALDIVKSYNYSKQVFIALSYFMGHRTVKDTIELLGVEPIEKIEFCFDYLEGMPDLGDFDKINLKEDLYKYVQSNFLFHFDKDGNLP